MLLSLLAFAASYGFHRDEMYFILAGRHPDFGYVDQPPLTPLLSAAATQLLGTSPFAVRFLPAIVAAAGVLVCAATARSFGAGKLGQSLAAVVFGASWWLGLGHLDATTTFDALAWMLALWLMVDLLTVRPGERNWRNWIALGAVMGIALENKTLPLLLAASLAAGLVLSRRWDVLRAQGLWVAVAIAAVLWAPDLAWQAQHGFTQITMAQHISGQQSDLGARAIQLFQLVIMAGPLLWPIALGGLLWLLRAEETRAWRPIGIAAIVNVGLVFMMGGKGYYSGGFIATLIAAGVVGLERSLNARPTRARWLSFSARAAGSAAIVALVALPVIPPAQLNATPVPALYQEGVAQIGWPELARQTEAVVAKLPAEERSHTAIIASNYGVYGALALLGRDLPPIYSGQNSIWYWGQPSDDTTTVVLVAWQPEWVGGVPVVGCIVAATIDNGYDLPTLEQGSDIFVCSATGTSWSIIWPFFKQVN